MISTRARRWGKMAQPMRMAICWTILMPVWRACHDFLLRQTALRNGSRAGMPSAEATTAKARAVVLRTYSSMLSMSGRMVEIMVARPAALARLEMISRPSTRA
uniref:Putative secreted protein n=1 Tax=Ixodes ricinus TaxID=34613 RepID=A0A6B0U7B1_IXORI